MLVHVWIQPYSRASSVLTQRRMELYLDDPDILESLNTNESALSLEDILRIQTTQSQAYL